MQPTTEPLIGLATLTAHAFRGGNLTPTAEQLFARIEQQPNDASAYMDLATIMFLSHQSSSALQLQTQAMALQARYRLSTSPNDPSIRILVLMAAGDLMDNTPLEFLLEGSTIAMDLHFMQPDVALPNDLGAYDLCFVAVGESDRNTPMLQQLAEQLRNSPVPILNAPQQIMQTTREGAAAALHATDGVLMPNSVRLSRQQLAAMDESVDRHLPNQAFPIIVRPTESHAGHGLAKLDSADAIAPYLAEQPEPQFYISPFIDYSSDDGQFRKYRIALIDGSPYLCHLAISSHWLVHYLNANMIGNDSKLLEEAHAMRNFDQGFGQRHQRAFAAIQHALQLEYLILDCAQTTDGQLLVFEVDTSAIVHAMDSIETFPYKRPQMLKTFHAFQHMLIRYAANHSSYQT
ncbi:MAG: hypothetical protein R8J85_09025 [Mariprofundales bacterium]